MSDDNSLVNVLRAGARVAGGVAEVAIAQARTTVQDNAHKYPVLSLGVQVLGLAEDLVAGARTDPGMVLDVVRAELERSVNRLGLATTAEVQTLKRRIDTLTQELAAAEDLAAAEAAARLPDAEPRERRPQSRPGTQSRSVTNPPFRPRPVARQDPGTQDPGTPDPGTQAAVTPPASGQAAGQRAAAKQSPAKSTTTRKMPPKKQPAKKQPAKKQPAKKDPGAGVTAKKSPAKSTATNSTAAKRPATKRAKPPAAPDRPTDGTTS